MCHDIGVMIGNDDGDCVSALASITDKSTHLSSVQAIVHPDRPCDSSSVELSLQSTLH